MANRYYHNGNWEAGDVWLTDQEAHHLLHVMRHRVGEQVELFDGRGHAARATIVEIQKRQVRLHIDEPLHTTLSDCSRTLILATAVPKGDRFRWLIEKATELGVTRLVPLHTERSVVAPRESKLDKQQQYVIEACKQSGRNTLLEFVPQQSLSEFLNSLSPLSCCVVGHPRATMNASELRSALHANQGEIALLVGPEGGFSPQEEQQLQERGVLSVSVAPHILRTETAGLLLAGVVAYLAAPPP